MKKIMVQNPERECLQRNAALLAVAGFGPAPRRDGVLYALKQLPIIEPATRPFPPCEGCGAEPWVQRIMESGACVGWHRRCAACGLEETETV